MKGIKLLAFLLLITASVQAQTFKASPNGVVSATDNKNFVVVEVKDASAKELFQRAYAYVVANYRNPDKVMSTMGEQMINIHSVSTDAYKCRGIGNRADVDMNTILQFKDGRFKIEVTVNEQIVRSFYKLGGVRFTPKDHPEYGPTVTMFETDGSVRSKVAVQNFNKWINDYLNPLIKWMQEPHNGSNTPNEDW